ncbi:HTH domain-containing protein [Paenibacillus dendritiformis]|uniref:HTH domain-containing protein n=1 Tax=Paenibacillus dendritiformis TaxID=130049 RepID=UPI0030B8C9A4
MRVERLLSMLLIISQRGKVTGQELAEHFEVSLRTLFARSTGISTCWAKPGCRSRRSAGRAEATT